MDEGATIVRVLTETDATRCVAEAARQCEMAGIRGAEAQAVSTAVSELARNILKYAESGELLFHPGAVQ